MLNIYKGLVNKREAQAQHEKAWVHAGEITVEDEKKNCGLSFLINRWCICES